MCAPIFRGIKVLGKSHDNAARELMEALYIALRGDDCVSQTSIVLLDSEFLAAPVVICRGNVITFVAT